MSIILPPWVEPLFTFYGLSWPDVDEDKVTELGQEIQGFTDSVVTFADAVDLVMRDVNNIVRVDALVAVEEAFASAKNTVVTPVADGIGTGAATAGHVVGTGIQLYKEGLLVQLGIALASDIVAIMVPGAGTAVLLAEQVPKRAILHTLVEGLTHEAIVFLVTQWHSLVEECIFKPIRDAAQSLGRELGEPIHKMVSGSLPTVDVSGLGKNSTAAGFGSSAAGFKSSVLQITESDIFEAGKKLKDAYEGLKGSIDTLRHWSKSHGYSTPTLIPDPLVSIELKKLADEFIEALLDEVDAIGSDIVNNIIGMLVAAYDRISGAESDMAALAERIRDTFEFPTFRELSVVFDDHAGPPLSIPKIPDFMLPSAVPADSDRREDMERLSSQLKDLLSAADEAAHSVPTIAHSDARTAIKRLDLPAPV